MVARGVAVFDEYMTRMGEDGTPPENSGSCTYNSLEGLMRSALEEALCVDPSRRYLGPGSISAFLRICRQ